MMITVAIALALAFAAECGPMALAADDCHREARVWAEAQVAGETYEWPVVMAPEAA